MRGSPYLVPAMSRKGVLLVNLGSPDSPSVGDVRRYLREFLMDPRVLDAPWPIRFCVVHFAILPSRPHQSAEAYSKVWLPEGSPLIVTSRRVRTELQQRLPIPVELAMRYQSPSIAGAVQSLARQGVTQTFLIPLFPHYAMSSWETAVEAVRGAVASRAPSMTLDVVPPYFENPDYITALTASAKPYLDKGYDHLLFSFHGIPERHLKKSDPTGSHCLSKPDCCAAPGTALGTCYKAQCLRTVHGFVTKLGIPADKYSVSFQSRLGRDPWLKPYTDFVIPELAKRGVKRLQVICPAFVSDCLETIEEIGIRGKELFDEAGGGEFTSIPCMNEHPAWLGALETMIRGWAG